MARQSRPPLKYKRLQGPRVIQLLVILPGSNDDEIVCETIEGVALDHREAWGIQYDALSHQWGNPELTSFIAINGCEFEVCTALNDALKGLRDSERKRTVWIDAISINQTDKKEKPKQFKLMLDIY
jgi:hypothetical protein